MAMKYYNLLFEKNAKNKKINKKLLIINKCLTFQIKHGYLNAITLNRMLLFVNKISKLKQIPVLFDLKNVILTDKLSYILFETICYELIKNGHTVFVNLDCKTDIRTIGIINSPLLLLNDRGKYILYTSNKLSHTKKLRMTLINMRRDAFFFKYKDNKFYISIRDTINSIEDLLVNSEGHMNKKDYLFFENKLDKRLEDLYSLIDNQTK